MKHPVLPRCLAPLLSCAVLLTALLVLPHSLAAAAAVPAAGRERILLDAGWRFALGHATDPARDFGHGTGYFSYLAKTGFGDGAASPAFDDRTWRQLDLPHDWAVEVPFDPRGSHSHGYKAVGPRFPERSVGWYRRSFHVPESDLGRRIRLDFDGVFRAARVFVNGFFVGEEPSGYLGASYDVSEYLNYGGDNVIAVRVDASMEEGWFYEGAGIYRHVWLVKTAPLHVALDGTWVRTDVSPKFATVTIETRVNNAGRAPADYTLEQEIFGPDGKSLARSSAAAPAVAPGGVGVHRDSLRVNAPQLWSLESPTMHRVVTTIRQANAIVDRYETPFGIRTIRFDPNRGFFLNGQRVVLKGTNNHQDHAGVGAAIPDTLQEFRIRRLKEMGSNAYRASHNPSTPELLDACDRLGMLVIEENRLMGINPYHLGQLERMIRRARNHPSIILWSLGNEEWGIEGNIKGARITVPMQDFAHRLDPTRRTTVAISGGWGGISSTVEVAGVNYVRQANVDKQHAEYPEQIIVGTEETTTQQTRGIYFTDRERAHLAPLEDGSSGGNCEFGWRYYVARPWAAGLFYWTGFDYRGEPTPFGYPAIASQFGILDTCGFPKDSFYYLKSWWTTEPVLHVFPHWNWAGREGQPLEVRVHSNCGEVELFLNGASLGRKTMEPNGHLAWAVNYTPGTLLARGFRDGKEIATTTVETTGAPVALALSADRRELRADSRDVAVITVEARDAEARLVPTGNVPVTFTLRGPGRIIGVGNGDPSSHEPDQFVASVRGINLGEWNAPDGSVKTGQNVFEATFDRPALGAGETMTLLLNALGTNQTATLNGEPLVRDAAPAQAKIELPLAADTLRPTGNVLRIEATRYEDWGTRDSLKQLWPATLRIVTPAPAWQRSTFNGLAQVIVQTTGEPGAIELVATSDGLKSASVELTSR
ncbi:beta-galactosidase GalA [Opitutus terrae]|uniref:Glycoside hydrolase family 2 sugar binding n=1 Tax=Opitutus terrae (strain DSM 11246 / JCM 15787 / PB90-1) TaxID=452637 RepID=B1ZXQ8_OPITP|nr:beta-galactosidase GalA [Opitutus terrae]ACB74280.1 glycoside hydrolase family 2 sugar binding [Opitutus terrae PB90-1]